MRSDSLNFQHSHTRICKQKLHNAVRDRNTLFAACVHTSQSTMLQREDKFHQITLLSNLSVFHADTTKEKKDHSLVLSKRRKMSCDNKLRVVVHACENKCRSIRWELLKELISLKLQSCHRIVSRTSLSCQRSYFWLTRWKLLKKNVCSRRSRKGSMINCRGRVFIILLYSHAKCSAPDVI